MVGWPEGLVAGLFEAAADGPGGLATFEPTPTGTEDKAPEAPGAPLTG